MRTVALHTLGCKVNYTETSTVARQFIRGGFRVVPPEEPCDVFVLNTCSVTERADRECRQVIRRILRSSPGAYVVVIGCYAQLQPDEIASIEGVDMILGTREKFNILSLAGAFTKKGVPQIFVSCIDEANDFEPSDSGNVFGRTRAFLKVQDGCDYSCAFCTIPRARGSSRSQSVEAVLSQAAALAAEGYREIVLTGVNVGDYGRNFGRTLLDLLESLETVTAIERIRISSIEPNLLSPEIISFILSSRRFCNHFHIPLQSGSDRILMKMRRRSLSSDYRATIRGIREKDPDSAIGCDILVGFPGETEELFEETRTFLEELPVSYVHVFTYSERENTAAAGFPGAVEAVVRSERSEILRELGARKKKAFFGSFIGRTLPVLFEHRVRSGRLSGLTANYLRVEAPTDDALVNQIRPVTLTGILGGSCTGRLKEGREAKIVVPTTVELSCDRPSF